MTEQKLGYSQLEVDQEFPAVNFNLDPDLVAAYLKATGETDTLYNGTRTVPPTAIAAWALISLLEHIELPDGTIHLSQEVHPTCIVKEGETLTCQAKISRKQERGQLKLLDIDFNVTNRNNESVLSGKSGFNFP